MRLILAALALLAALAPARAGDAAELNILGFAKNGAIFAFEEYGVQDGSGFPYANRFYIDTATDKFLPGSPVRVRIDDETAGLSTVRKQAADAGQKLVSDAELADNRGYTVAARAITQESDNPLEFIFKARPIFPSSGPRLGFRIEAFDMPAPANCGGDEKFKGFRLLRLNPDSVGDTSVVFEDKAIPDSRHCPLDYQLGAVQTWYSPDGNGVFAVLVSVISIGFEGPNHRWIAITGKI